MNTFLEYFLGNFNNRQQTFAHPTRYSYIRILHKKINDELIYGEQAYAFKDVNPYRQFVLKPIVIGDNIKILNYGIKNPLTFVKGKNLDQLMLDDLTEKTECATIFSEKDSVYYGKLVGCKCYVNWNGKQTYMENDIILGNNYYNVLDRGMCPDTHKQIWGSRFGHFKFVKQLTPL